MEVMKAFIFGFILSLSIGPIAILVLNNGIQHGYTVAVRSAIGAALADYCYALISFIVGTWIIISFTDYHYQIILLSSWVLIFVGFYMMFGALQNTRLLANFSQPTRKLGFRAAFYLTLANPIAVIALSAFIGHATDHVDLLFSLQLAGAIFTGSLVIQCILAISGSFFKDHFDTLTFPFYLQLLGGLLICLFGVYNFVELAK